MSKSTKVPLTGRHIVTLDQDVSKAFVFLRGYELRFSNNEDHEIAEQIVKVELEKEDIEGRNAIVKVTLALRDKKSILGHELFDDQYEGKVYFTVVGLLKGVVTEMKVRYQ